MSTNIKESDKKKDCDLHQVVHSGVRYFFYFGRNCRRSSARKANFPNTRLFGTSTVRTNTIYPPQLFSHDHSCTWTCMNILIDACELLKEARYMNVRASHLLCLIIPDGLVTSESNHEVIYWQKP